MSGELVARLTTYPRMQQALASLPPKMLSLASSRLPQVIELTGDLVARIDTVKARISKATFTGKGDIVKVPCMYEDYVKRIAEVLQSTLALAGVEAGELTLPVAPTVKAPNAPALRLADGQLLLSLHDVDRRAAGGEGASQIGMVRGEHIELLLVGSDAKFVLDSCSQVVLPWRPPVEGWSATFQLGVKKLIDLKERVLSLNEDVQKAEELAKKVKESEAFKHQALSLKEDVKTVEESEEGGDGEEREEGRDGEEREEGKGEGLRKELIAQLVNVAACVEALLPVIEDPDIKRRVEETIEMVTLRQAVESALEAVRSNEHGHLEMQLETLRCSTSRIESKSNLEAEALVAYLLRAEGVAGERRYASGQWLTVRQPDGQWSDARVSIAGVPSHVAGQELPLHPWNHAPRELPHADFETLRLWWIHTLRIQHSQMTDALTGRRLDVMTQCVAINMVGADGGDIREARSLSDWLCARYADLCQGGVVNTPSAIALLVGPPAAGKTSLMSQVIVHSLDAELVPVFIKVQRLQRSLLLQPEAFGKAWNWVDAYLRLEHQDQPTVYYFLRQALLSRRVLLLLDGLDEGGAKRSEIERHVTEVLAPQGHVMLCSSRPAGLNYADFVDFRRLELSPLREDQQEQALQQRLGADRVGPLLKYLKALPAGEDGQRVTANPLMLSMVASVYEIRQGVGMPESTAELYNIASEAMLARGGASSPELRKLLRAVFFEAHLSSQREVSESLLTKAARKAGISEKVLDEFRSRAMQDKLPLVSLLTTEPLLLQSSHLSFQEYFAARALCEESTRNERLPQQQLWRWPAWWDNALKIGEGMGERFSKGLSCAVGLESNMLDLSRGRLDGDRPLAFRVRAICALLFTGSLTTLYLSENKLGPEGGVAVAEALKVNGSLTALRLGDNAIGDEGATALGAALTVNSSLTSLDIHWNKIGAKGGRAIAEALRVNNSLTEINLDNFALPVKKLKGTDPVESLDLSQKGLAVASAIVIASLIGANGSLTSLNLFNNKIGAEGGVALAEALKVNGLLRSLDLSSNPICGLGSRWGQNGTHSIADINAICQALRVNNSLTVINLNGFALPVKKLKGTDPVESLDLSQKGLAVASAIVIASLIGVNGLLTSLDLGSNYIQGEGVKAVAKALRVSGSLMSVNLCNNGFGAENARLWTRAASVPAPVMTPGKDTGSVCFDAGIGFDMASASDPSGAYDE